MSGRPDCAPALGNTTGQGQERNGSSVTLVPRWATEPGPVVSRAAKKAPLCKGSCRRTPTEGLTASLRSQAVLPVPCRDGQAVLPVRCPDGHTALPHRATEPGPVVSARQGLHTGPYRCWLASTGAQEQTAHTAFREFWLPRHWTFQSAFNMLYYFSVGKFPEKKLDVLEDERHETGYQMRQAL